MKTNNLTSPPRQRTSVAIQGLDTSTPDDLVTDGKCSTLHNLRYKDGAWRPVHPYSELLKVGVPQGSKVAYKHPIEDGIYIIERLMVTGKYLYYAAIGSELVELKAFDTPQKVSHFGNVLIFLGEEAVTRLIYNRGKYIEYWTPLAPNITISQNEEGDYKNLPDYFRLDTDIYREVTSGSESTLLRKKDAWIHKDHLGQTLLDIEHYNNSLKANNRKPVAPVITCLWLLSDADTLNSLIPVTPDDYSVQYGSSSWHGEVALFAAYHTASGDVVSPSPLHIALSDNTILHSIKQEAFFSLYTKDFAPYNDPSRRYIGCLIDLTYTDAEPLSAADIREHCPYSYTLPTLSISTNRPNTDIITGVAIYATRIHPIFNPGLTEAMSNEIPTHRVWAQNKLPEQPFYLVKEFPIIVDEEGDYIDRFELPLDSQVLQQAIHNRLYVPTIYHDIYGDIDLDYNNAQHIGGVHTLLRRDILLTDALQTDKRGLLTTPFLTLDINNQEKYVRGDSVYSTGIFKAPFEQILSYHDARARKYVIDGGDWQSLFALQSADANNIAYFTIPSNDVYKYPSFMASGGILPNKHIEVPAASDTLYEPNRVQVSATNNCLTFPFDRSYRVGSANNRIIALQSGAIKIADEKVGALPLYIFTTEGVFALTQGENTLYASVVPINYDKVINPNTLAINGAVVYISEKGVHMLTSQGSQIISEAINDIEGHPNLYILRDCKILHPKQDNDIIFYKEGYDAYVYNLDTGYWATRHIEGTKINEDELVVGNIVYDLNKEDYNKTLEPTLTTRPIKLGNVELKRLETIIPRMYNGPTEFILNMSIQGTVDGMRYSDLRNIEEHTVGTDTLNSVIIRRTPFSAKYFKCAMEFLELQGEGKLNVTITHIDFEWYNRFVRRMR